LAIAGVSLTIAGVSCGGNRNDGAGSGSGAATAPEAGERDSGEPPAGAGAGAGAGDPGMTSTGEAAAEDDSVVALRRRTAEAREEVARLRAEVESGEIGAAALERARARLAELESEADEIRERAGEEPEPRGWASVPPFGLMVCWPLFEGCPSE